MLAYIAHQTVDTVQPQKVLNMHTTNLRQTSIDLQLHMFDLPGQADIDETSFNNSNLLEFKINEITSTLGSIQDRNTLIRRTKSIEVASKYPWLKNNTRYQNALKSRNAAKKAFIFNQNEVNKAKLKTSNVVLASLYTQLKTKYYEKIIAEMNMQSGDSRKFYNFVRTKKKSHVHCCQIPCITEALRTPET